MVQKKEYIAAPKKTSDKVKQFGFQFHKVGQTQSSTKFCGLRVEQKVFNLWRQII